MKENHLSKKDLTKHLAPFFKEHGFVKKGNAFYKIENQIAQFVYFCGDCNIKIFYGILPLYLPREFLMLEDGEEMNYSSWVKCSVRAITFYYLWYGGAIDDNEVENSRSVLKYVISDDIEQLNDWFNELKEFCTNYMFHYFQSIDSPEKLLKFTKEPQNRCKWSAPDLWFYYLRAYTNFYLSNFRDMKKDIKLGINACKRFGLREDLIIKYQNEMDKLIELSKAPKQEREAFINECNNFTADHCFKNIKREPYIM